MASRSQSIMFTKYAPINYVISRPLGLKSSIFIVFLFLAYNFIVLVFISHSVIHVMRKKNYDVYV